MEDFLRETRFRVAMRQMEGKKDAYFVIPDNITVDQIHEQEFELRCSGAEGYRIFHSRKLHLYWGYGHRNFDKSVQGYPRMLTKLPASK